MKALILAFVVMSAHAADIKYPVSAIPETLKKDVHAVIREHDLTFRIVSQHGAIQTNHLVVTILSAAGDDYAILGVGYDKLRKVNSLRAAVYDATGKLVKKVKGSDFKDQSNFDGLYSDDRAKLIDLTQATYPYTIEFEYEIEYKFLFYIPGMHFLPNEDASVQSSKYTLAYTDGLKPRYYAHLLPQKPLESTTPDGLHQLTWQMNDLLPPAGEPFGPRYEELTPYLLAAPSKFEYEGYVGSMETWDGFGKWIASLLEGRQNLPEVTKAKARALTANATTIEEKTRILYTYLQNKTRYVSVQLGIGGFQPFDAATVDNVGYGDCKALSNYMVALLDAVGVKSHYAMIESGVNPPPLKVGFPSSQFDHVIVAVPNGKDTVWLECTSQVNPFGFPGNFTGNRRAVIVTDNGARVAQTTSYDERVNKQLRKAFVTIAGNGNATASVSTIYSGLQYESRGLSSAIHTNHDDQKKWVQNSTQIPSFEIERFSMKDNKFRVPSADVKLDLVLNRFASVSGKRMFVPANLMNRYTNLPEKVTDRKNNVFIRSAYTHIDTVEYSVPESLYPEFVPEPIHHVSRFGEYEVSVKLSAGKVIYARKMVMRQGEYPAASYNELVEFLKNVNRADNLKLVFLSKT